MIKFVTGSIASLALAASPAFADGPLVGPKGSIAAPGCSYIDGEPIGLGGGPAGGCTYIINGNNGGANFGDLSGSLATARNGTVKRPIGDHFHDVINPVDYGAYGNGAADSGPAVQTSITEAQSTGSPILFSRSAGGYLLNGTTPGFTVASNGRSYSYPGLLLGDYDFAETKLAGSMLGSPTAGAAMLNNTYTNPFNTVMDIKHTGDPAGMPLRSGVDPISGAPGGTTNIGYSWECAPNRPNPLSYDTNGKAVPNHNWMACTYIGIDTGKGGAAGTTINSGGLNLVLNLDENSGTGAEIDVNSNGTGVKDGGVVRGLFIAGGGNAGNRFDNTIGIDIVHGQYGPGRMPFTTGIQIRSAETMLRMQKDIANETGYFVQAYDENNAAIYSLDKNGFEAVSGVNAANNVTALTLQTRPRPFAYLPICASQYEGLEASVTDSQTASWGMEVRGNGANAVGARCNGTKWTVFAK